MSSSISNRHEGDLDGKLVPIDGVQELTVTVVVDENSASLPSTQHTAWTLINLLARLKRVVKGVGLVCPAVPMSGRVVPLARPGRDLSNSILSGAAEIGAVPVVAGGVGGLLLEVGPGAPSDHLRVYGEAWWGGISVQEIATSEHSPLPFGPYGAACIASAEVL